MFKLSFNYWAIRMEHGSCGGLVEIISTDFLNGFLNVGLNSVFVSIPCVYFLDTVVN